MEVFKGVRDETRIALVKYSKLDSVVCQEYYVVESFVHMFPLY